MYKKIIAILCSLTLIITSVVPAFAAERDTQSVNVMERQSFTNPLYPDVIIEGNTEKLFRESQGKASHKLNSDTDVSLASYETDFHKVVADVRKQMVARDDAHTVYYRVVLNQSGDEQEQITQVIEDIFNAAVKHTGNPKEGDSLLWVYARWGHDAFSYRNLGNVYFLPIPFLFEYYTTAAQEAELDQAVAALKTTLNVDQMSDVKKVDAIYDYICENISYDNTIETNPNYDLMYTAYAALINKTAVCQGYAALFYRLALEYGIDSRVIGGYGFVGDSGGPHGWNIVKLDGVYYYLDSTWDAGYPPEWYAYYLKGSDSFLKDHTCDDEYTTKAFRNACPVMKADYDGSQHKHTTTPMQTIASTCAKQGTTYHECTGCSYGYDETLPLLPHVWEADYTIDKAASYAGNGSKSKHCANCNQINAASVVVIPKKVCNLAAPASVTSTLTAGTSIKVSWKGVSGASGYYVRYKKASASKWTWASPTSAKSKTLKGLTAGAKYNIRVYPYIMENGTNYKSSKYKAAPSIYTLAKVAKPTVKRSTKNAVKVKWKNINGETGYEISVAKKKSGTTVVKTYKTKSTKYITKSVTVKKGTKRYIKVRAYKNVKMNGKTKKVYGKWSTPVLCK